MNKEYIIFVIIIVILVLVIAYQHYSFNKSLDDIKEVHMNSNAKKGNPQMQVMPGFVTPQVIVPVADPMQELLKAEQDAGHSKVRYNSSIDDSVTVTYYYSPGCGHCTHFMPEWEKFNAKHNSPLMKKVNCMEQPDLCENIRGVPHVIFSKNGKDTVYSGARTADALDGFYASM